MISFLAMKTTFLLRAGLRAGLGMSYECNVGACGSCKFDLVEGDVEVLWEDAPGLTDRDKKRGRKLACQCRPKGDVTINMRLDDTFKPFVRPERFTARLVSVRALTPDMNEFTFEGKNRQISWPGNTLCWNYPALTPLVLIRCRILPMRKAFGNSLFAKYPWCRHDRAFEK